MGLPALLRRLPWRELKYAAWLPVFLILFVLIEHLPLSAYHATQLPLDDLIPFREEFALFYVLWYPFMVVIGVYLLFRDPPAFRRYMAFLAVTFFASEIIWLLYPNGQDLRPAVLPRQNFLTALMEALYRIDTNTDVLPSVHVLGAIGGALGVWDSQTATPLLRRISAVLAFLICLSTLFVKQHSILDVVAALVVAAAAFALVYPLPRLARRKMAGGSL